MTDLPVTSTRPAGDFSLPRLSFLILCLLCAALAAGLLYPGASGDFVFDDRPNIIENTALHLGATVDGESFLYAAYSFQPGHGSRALAMLSFAFDHWRGGLDPWVYKTTNLLIHALTTLALAYFLRRLLELAAWPPARPTYAALALALAWGIHPLQVSSVLYVVQRMQTMSTLFLVLALLAYLKARQAQIEGRPSRRDWLLALLSWCLAFASKEDSVLLPAYTLALELTVLNFRAARSDLARLLRKTYLVLGLAGAAVYLFWAVPRFWHWDVYSGRDFSSLERLLTQGRVLVMYLGQILLPLPERLPFYYDGLTPSRGLLEPVATLPALLLLAALLTLAWRWRQRRPVFALGVFLFFAGHFVTSNVIGLELAFEHRNHFPLIGAVLAVGDLCLAAFDRLRISPRLRLAVVAALLLAAGSLTAVRAHAWGDRLGFARTSVDIAPQSARAWLVLGATYFEMSGSKPESPYLELAVQACQKGGELPYSANPLANVVIFKSIQGTVTEADWQRLLARLRTATMNVENRRLIWVMVDNMMRKIPLNEAHVLETMAIIVNRTTFEANDYLNFGYFVLGHTSQPDTAYPYLVRAVNAAAPGDAVLQKMLSDLEGGGYEDWAQELRAMARAQGKLPAS